MDVRTGLLAFTVLARGCIDAPQAPPRRQSGVQSDPQAKPATVQPSPAIGPRFELAPAAGDVDTVVREAVVAAKGERVVVYVGATWCEPCQYFHNAVEAGELDDALPGVKFLEFDADRDGERLAMAGYDGRLIPRFALPGDDGRFGGTKIEGGVKGDGAVDHILRRLQPMLAGAAR